MVNDITLRHVFPSFLLFHKTNICAKFIIESQWCPANSKDVATHIQPSAPQRGVAILIDSLHPFVILSPRSTFLIARHDASFISTSYRRNIIVVHQLLTISYRGTWGHFIRFSILLFSLIFYKTTSWFFRFIHIYVCILSFCCNILLYINIIISL